MWLFQQLNNYIICLTCGVSHIFIVVLSWDGKSISGSWDTLTEGGLCAHPGTILGWSEYPWSWIVQCCFG